MLVYDLETDGLLDVVTKIHCLNIKDRATSRRYRFNAGRYDHGTPNDSAMSGLGRLRK